MYKNPNSIGNSNESVHSAYHKYHTNLRMIILQRKENRNTILQFLVHSVNISRYKILKITHKRTNGIKNDNVNVHWTHFSKLSTWYNPRSVNVTLISINQSSLIPFRRYWKSLSVILLIKYKQFFKDGNF